MTQDPVTPSARRVALGVAAAAVGAAALLLLAGGGWTALAGGAAGTRGIWRNGLFLLCGAITLLCVLGLAVLCGAMWAAGASARARREEPTHGQDAHATRGQDARATQEGSAMLEFVLVLPFALFFVLLLTQSSLLMGGSLCVNYSAFCAARSAIVTVPLNFGSDEPPNMVGDVLSSGKMARIRDAAVWAVLPVSGAHPEGPAVNASRIQAGMDTVVGQAGSWPQGDLDHRLGYAREHTAVDLDLPRRVNGGPAMGIVTGGSPGLMDMPSFPVIRPHQVLDPQYGGGGGSPVLAGSQANQYESNEDLTVRVRHDFYLSIPYAARVFATLSPDGMTLEFGRNQFAMVMQAQCTLTNEGVRDWVDVEQFPRDRFRR